MKRWMPGEIGTLSRTTNWLEVSTSMTSPSMLQVTGAIEAARGFDDVLQVGGGRILGGGETQILEGCDLLDVDQDGAGIGNVRIRGLAVFRQVVQVVEIEIAGEGSVSGVRPVWSELLCRPNVVGTGVSVERQILEVTALVSSPVRRRR